MGWAEDARKHAEKVAAEKAEAAKTLPTAPRPDVAQMAPSEWLERLARECEAAAQGHANSLMGVVFQKSALVPPPQVPPAEMLRMILGCQLLGLRLQAATNDMLLTFLTGRPELRPFPPEKPS